ncbi:cupin domain-containing protein [Bacillus alkalicola]
MYQYGNYNMYPYPYWGYPQGNMPHFSHARTPEDGGHAAEMKDYGPEPFTVNIEQATMQNQTYRTALWTGENLQLTLMSINPGDDIGLEIHNDHDQFIRIEQGHGLVFMGDEKNKYDFEKHVTDGSAIFIPAGKWHNVVNYGQTPLKLYSIYAPPEHPAGTVHPTKADAGA